MEMNCYYCHYYGKCSLDVKKCSEFTEFDKEHIDVVLNIERFDEEWKSRHFNINSFDPTILQGRVAKRNKMLNGETAENYLTKLEHTMANQVVEGVSGGNERYTDSSFIGESTEGV